MKLLDKVEKLNIYIRENYPTLEFGHISLSNEAVGNICRAVLGIENSKIKSFSFGIK